MPYTPLLRLQMLLRTTREMLQEGGRIPGSNLSDRTIPRAGAIRMLHLKSLWVVAVPAAGAVYMCMQSNN